MLDKATLCSLSPPSTSTLATSLSGRHMAVTACAAGCGALRGVFLSPDEASTCQWPPGRPPPTFCVSDPSRWGSSPPMATQSGVCAVMLGTEVWLGPDLAHSLCFHSKHVNPVCVVPLLSNSASGPSFLQWHLSAFQLYTILYYTII